MKTTKNPLNRLAAAVAHAFTGKGAAKGLDREIATAESGAGAVRKLNDDYNPTGAKPAEIAALLAEAAQGKDLVRYYALAEKLEELDTQYRSLISTRKLAVCGLPIIVEPADNSRQAKRAAALVKEVFESEAFASMLSDLLDGLSKGTSVVEIAWDTSGEYWKPSTYKHRPMRWFGFSKDDGKTPMLRGPQDTLKALEPNRFITHQPQLKSGLPVSGGLAIVAAWAWVLKAAVLSNWTGFCETYGQPMRVGRYEKGTRKEDVQGLRKALQALGANAYAVLDKTMAVEFIEAGGKGGSSDLFERIIRYLDEQEAKLVLGQTLTSGSGDGVGSQALGKVHNEVRADILRADARQVMATLARDLVRPLIEFNFGPGVAFPRVRFQIDEPEDLVGLVDIVDKLAERGLPIPRAWVHDKFGIPAPDEGEEVLTTGGTGSSAAPAPNTTQDPEALADTAANSRQGAASVFCPVHSSAHAQDKQGKQRDALDDLNEAMLGEWEPSLNQLQQELEAAVAGADDFKSLQKALGEFVRAGKFDKTADMLANARAIAQLAARADADIGGAA